MRLTSSRLSVASCCIMAVFFGVPGAKATVMQLRSVACPNRSKVAHLVICKKQPPPERTAVRQCPTGAATPRVGAPVRAALGSVARVGRDLQRDLLVRVALGGDEAIQHVEPEHDQRRSQHIKPGPEHPLAQQPQVVVDQRPELPQHHSGLAIAAALALRVPVLMLAHRRRRSVLLEQHPRDSGHEGVKSVIGVRHLLVANKLANNRNSTWCSRYVGCVSFDQQGGRCAPTLWVALCK